MPRLTKSLRSLYDLQKSFWVARGMKMSTSGRSDVLFVPHFYCFIAYSDVLEQIFTILTRSRLFPEGVKPIHHKYL